MSRAMISPTGLSRGANEMHLETAADNFISDRKFGHVGRKAIQPRTQRRYKWSLHCFADWVKVTYGRPKATALNMSAQLVRDYIAYRSAQDRAMNTIAIDCAALGEFARWGNKKRLWKVDAEDLPIVDKPKGTPRALLPEHRNLVMGLPLTGADAVLRALLYYLGGRLEEILTIRLRDIRPPHVLPDGTTLTGRITLWGKGRKERIIGIHPDLWAVLEPHLAPMKGRPSDCTLLHRDGEPWSAAMIYSRVRAWAKAAGIERFTPHEMRHTFATDYLEAATSAEDIKTLQELLGHERLSTTEIYLRVADRRKIDAVLRLPSFRGQAAD